MQKIIEIDLMDPDSLKEKYNGKKVSRELINYLLEEASSFKKNDKVKIAINNKTNDYSNFSKLIVEGLKDEYSKSQKKHIYTNIMQIIYLIIGIITLSFSSLIKVDVFKEVVLIGGWVLIWSMVELEIFSDMDERRKRKILKKLLKSKIIEIKN